MKRPAKVLVVLPNLGTGGAERVVALLMQGLSPSKYESHLALIAEPDTGPAWLPQWVAIHRLGARRVRRGALRLLKLVWCLKPDLIFCSMFHVNFLVLLLRPFFPRTKAIVVRQNGTISASLRLDKLPRFARILYSFLYPRADCIVCQTDAMAKDMMEELAIPADRLVVLPNPLDIEEIRNSAVREAQDWPGPGPHLLAVGRLAPEKGYDLLLRALPAVQKHFPCADLVIAGTGPEEASLKSQCNELGLHTAVDFAGHVPPHRYFRDATLFVLPSRHEGLPNALLEAAAAGLPLVAAPAGGGVVELLRDQPGTWVAQEASADALASALIVALDQLTPAQRFTHSFIERFRLGRAVAAYETLFDATLLARRP